MYGVHMQRIENQIETYNSLDTGKFKKRGVGGGEGISSRNIGKLNRNNVNKPWKQQ